MVLNKNEVKLCNNCVHFFPDTSFEIEGLSVKVNWAQKKLVILYNDQVIIHERDKGIHIIPVECER